MFSATVPRAIAELARHLPARRPRVTVQGEAKAHGDIDLPRLCRRRARPRERDHQPAALARPADGHRVLQDARGGEPPDRAAVNRGFSVVALSGELSQAERTHALQAVRDGRARVCVATDVAARGIDLPGLELVIHADLPAMPTRCCTGRAARGGRAPRASAR
jgi:ATP-dependent RNA helicase DeaD